MRARPRSPKDFTSALEVDALCRRRIGSSTATSGASSSAVCWRSARTRMPIGCACARSTGEGDARQIVCGAWNFEAARPSRWRCRVRSSRSSTGRSTSELRGQLSRGMILAEDEIGLGDDHAGIMVLADGSAPGTPLVDVLPIRDQVLDVTPTVNRVDLLSMVGVARAVAAPSAGTSIHLSPTTRPSSMPRRSRSRSRTSSAARGTSAASFATSRSARRRNGCGRGSSSPRCGRSPTSSM